MNQSAEQPRRRKGISVSLTPNKDTRNEGSPIKNSNIILQQSHAYVEEVPKRTSVRAFQEKPAVHFQYSNVSKEQEVRESLALDQELCILRKQVQDKREAIANLQK